MTKSPDGQWFWNGNEWVPSLPFNPPPPLPPPKTTHLFIQNNSPPVLHQPNYGPLPPTLPSGTSRPQPNYGPLPPSLPSETPKPHPNLNNKVTSLSRHENPPSENKRLPMGSPPKTDAFDTKIRLNYPKDLPDSRKTFLWIQTFSFTMIWLSSIIVISEGGNFTGIEWILVCSLLVVMTLLSSSFSYYFGIGIVDIVFLKWKYTLIITLMSCVAFFYSPIIAFYLAKAFSLQSTIYTVFSEIYVLLENIYPGVGEKVIFVVGCLGTMIPYIIFTIVSNKFWGREYQKNWIKMIRIEPSKDVKKRKSSILNAIGFSIFGYLCIIYGILAFPIQANFVSLFYLFVGVLSIVYGWLPKMPDKF